MIIEWLDKSGANGANYSNEAAKSVSDCVIGRAVEQMELSTDEMLKD